MEPQLPTAQKILYAASSLFLEEGFIKVNVDRIASTAGITKVTVYKHFGSKEALLIECLNWRLASREKELDALLGGTDHSETVVLRLFDWMQERGERGCFHGCAFLKSTLEMATELPEVRMVAVAAKALLRKRIITALLRGGVHPAKPVGETIALLFEGAQSLSVIEQNSRPYRIARLQVAEILAAHVNAPRSGPD